VIAFREGAAGDADVLAVAVGEDRRFDAAAEELREQISWLDSWLDDSQFTGETGQVAVVPTESPPRTALVGGAIATTLHAAAGEGAAEAVGLGFSLGTYTFHRHKSEPKPSELETVILVDASPDDVAKAREGAIVGDAVCLARDLINEPAIFKSPEVLADLAAELASDAGMTATILDEDDIEGQGLGGLLGVSLGAANPPRLVQLAYEPEGASKFVAFVGKGIVFDSGGLTLKTAEGLEAMKTDMSGAAAVFAAMKAIAALELPVKVVGIAPLTENMPGGSALRPGDVLTARNGKTIEVLNTDAEGRLVLADGLSLAAELGPDLVVDIATLTGSCKIALGPKIAGLFGDDSAVEAVTAAAEAAGERVWRLPLPEDYRKSIDSEIADMKNVGGKVGGAIFAALLLKEFVGDTPWAHLDIAGPARSDEVDNYVTKGGTGFGVRTLVELARRLA
jgi:leucyl aminopeptidase